jgi:nitronate monooxygenase
MRPLRNTERVLNNAAAQKLLEKETNLGDSIKIDDVLDQVAGVYPKVMVDGEMEAGVWSCGMVVGLINDIPSCKDLIERTMAEAKLILDQRSQQLSA